MSKLLPHILVCLCLIIAGCHTMPNTVVQTSTIDALLAGHYDGSMTCRQLLSHGDFGIGTFDKLDGEMVVLDGRVYQVKVDGNVYKPNMNTKTPFASVCKFHTDKSIDLKSGTDFSSLETIIDDAVASENLFCAVRIDGNFSYIKTRSVPAQSKPYPELSEVTKTQAVFEFENISGTIVGFRCPEFVEGVNVPGYHLHFLSNDGTKGGHLLELTLENGTAEVDLCSNFLLLLPQDSQTFSQLDLSKDRTEELNTVER